MMPQACNVFLIGGNWVFVHN